MLESIIAVLLILINQRTEKNPEMATVTRYTPAMTDVASTDFV